MINTAMSPDSRVAYSGKGFSQKYGINYDETHSKVVRFSSVSMLPAWAVCYKMKIQQMDVTTAFLNGDLEEEIYMQQPDGYVQPGKENLAAWSVD